jgi:hypothetical protein
MLFGTTMRARLLAACLLALPAFGLTAQEASGPRLHFGAGVAGQRDGDRDLGPALHARLGATVFSLPTGQGCFCDPGDPPLGVQGAYGALFAVESVPRGPRLYWLGGASYRRGGFLEWNEHQSAGILAGIGWALGRKRQGALEARYEHFLSPLGATRALLPLYLTWRL